MAADLGRRWYLALCKVLLSSISFTSPIVLKSMCAVRSCAYASFISERLQPCAVA